MDRELLFGLKQTENSYPGDSLCHTLAVELLHLETFDKTLQVEGESHLASKDGVDV